MTCKRQFGLASQVAFIKSSVRTFLLLFITSCLIGCGGGSGGVDDDTATGGNSDSVSGGGITTDNPNEGESGSVDTDETTVTNSGSADDGNVDNDLADTDTTTLAGQLYNVPEGGVVGESGATILSCSQTMPCTIVTSESHRIALLEARTKKNLSTIDSERDVLELDIAVTAAFDVVLDIQNVSLTARQLSGANYIIGSSAELLSSAPIAIAAGETRAFTFQAPSTQIGSTVVAPLRSVDIGIPALGLSSLSVLFQLVETSYSEFGTPMTDTSVEGCDANEEQFTLAVPPFFSVNLDTDDAVVLTDRFNDALNGIACMELFRVREVDDFSNLAQLQSGEFDLYLRSYTVAQQDSPVYQLFDLPYLFNDFDNLFTFQSGAGGDIVKSASLSADLQGLVFWNSPPVQLVLDVPAVPANLSGKKIQVSGQSTAVISRQYEILGAAGVSFPVSETENGLVTGIIDGAEMNWDGIFSSGLDSLPVTITESNIRYPGHMVFTSSERWAEFDPDVRSSVLSVLTTLASERDRELVQRNNKALQALITRGATVSSLDDNGRTAWFDAMVSVRAQFQDEIGVDLINQALDAR